MRTSTILSVLASALLTQSAAIQPRGTGKIVDLGLAVTYGVLTGGAGLTNVGNTVVTGNLGTTGTATGFGPGVVTGVQNIGNAAANSAFVDVEKAYAQAKGLTGGKDISVLNDLTGTTIYPGIYSAADTIVLTGQLFLDAKGNSSKTFVFQSGKAMLFNLGSEIILLGGAKASNVFWQTGSAATIAVGVAFQGNLLAYAGIAVMTGASVNGGLYALTESVTLQNNAVTAQII